MKTSEIFTPMTDFECFTSYYMLLYKGSKVETQSVLIIDYNIVYDSANVVIMSLKVIPQVATMVLSVWNR